MLSWLRRRKAEKKAAVDITNLFAVLKEIKRLETRLADYMWIMAEHHRDILPEQTQLFSEKTEFALKSLISCYGIAAERKKAQLIKDRIISEKAANQAAI